MTATQLCLFPFSVHPNACFVVAFRSRPSSGRRDSNSARGPRLRSTDDSAVDAEEVEATMKKYKVSMGCWPLPSSSSSSFTHACHLALLPQQGKIERLSSQLTAERRENKQLRSTQLELQVGIDSDFACHLRCSLKHCSSCRINAQSWKTFSCSAWMM